MFQPHVILHPTDFSDSSAHAFEIAVDLARQHRASLLVLHVVDSLGPESVTYGEAISQLEPEGFRNRLEDELRQRSPAPGGVPTQYLLAAGEPISEIVRACKDHSCDLIVMGTHGRTGLNRLLMGSATERLIRHAPCPVLVARLPASDTSQS
jgi:nucleotide-binding universal stress UspA family protein